MCDAACFRKEHNTVTVVASQTFQKITVTTTFSSVEKHKKVMGIRFTSLHMISPLILLIPRIECSFIVNIKRSRVQSGTNFLASHGLSRFNYYLSCF